MLTKVICINENLGRLMTERDSQYIKGNIYYAEEYNSGRNYHIYTANNSAEYLCSVSDVTFNRDFKIDDTTKTTVYKCHHSSEKDVTASVSTTCNTDLRDFKIQLLHDIAITLLQTRNMNGSTCDIDSIPDIATRLTNEIVEKIK